MPPLETSEIGEWVLWGFGWLLWALALELAISSFVHVLKAARTRGPTMLLRPFQFGWMLTLTVLFVAFDWDKLHLAWAIPACWAVYITPVGMPTARAIGHLTQLLFTPADD